MLNWEARRGLTALPQPELDSSGHFDDDLDAQAYHRRLQEMESARRSNSMSTRPQRRRRLPDLPSTAQVLERLQSASPSSSCGQQAAPGSSSGSRSDEVALDWREVVAAMRASQQTISGERMLTDTFGRRHTYLRISLTERCNLRCLYCMPEEGVDLTPSSQLMTTEEVMRVARLFVGAGVDKIRLTGGEPTLRPDLPELVGRMAALSGVKAVGITTNGIVLDRRMEQLREAGLTLLNISLDTLRPERFEAMTRRRGHDRVLRSIHAAVRCGFDPVKVNVVVMRGVNDDEIPDFVELTRHHPINVRFIEYMPFDGNVWSDTKMVPYRDMVAAVEGAFPQGLERCRDPRGEVAKNFKVPGFRGSVSFITSMTSAFCSDCNRVRVMADGNLKVCLFGANEVSLRDAMRDGASDDDLRYIVSAAVDRKRAAHAGMFELAKSPNRAMIKIGG